MKSIGFLVLSVGVLVSVLALETSLAVMNGRDADLTKSVATVFIFPEKAIRTCTAVIVAPQLLFTAGHCTEGIQKKVFKLKIANDLNADVKRTVTVLQWKAAPGYTESNKKDLDEVQYDFAFLRTRENLLETFGLKAEQIPRVASSLKELQDILTKHQSLKAYGYGMYAKNKDEKKKELNQAHQLVEEHKLIKTTSLEKSAGVCQGDSGGGLFAEENGKLILLGNLSGILASKGCGSDESYAVYTWTHTHLCWVKKMSGIQVGNVVCH